MLITRTSIFTGKTRSREINVTEEQFQAWANGALIQNAFPGTTSDEREFIMTGLTTDEWNEEFPDE